LGTVGTPPQAVPGATVVLVLVLVVGAVVVVVGFTVVVVVGFEHCPSSSWRVVHLAVVAADAGDAVPRSGNAAPTTSAATTSRRSLGMDPLLR